MRLSRVASTVLMLLAPALVHCELTDDGPPPAAAQNTMTAPPGTDVPPSAPAAGGTDTAAASGGGGMYVSGEYALGDDVAPAAGAAPGVPAAASASADAYQDNDPAALSDFRTTLDPYGAWVDDSTYGTVWVPSPRVVGADFVPYTTAGHWVYDDDYVWVSDYEWGWAPFHYGRWVYIGGRGWSWIPGRVYRGAWVTWGVDDGYTYVGWYPMAPAFVWFGGAAVVYGGYAAPYWSYCPHGEVFSPVVGQRVVRGAAAAPVAAGVRVYTPATPGVSGPPPGRLGFNAAQVPHATGNAAARLARAQQFSRPSTAQALGAHPPARVAGIGSAAGRTPYAAGGRPGVPSYAHGAVPGGVHPVVPGGRKPSYAPGGPPAPARGGYRGGGFHGGGSFHGGGGGFHGGGGHR